MKQLIPLVAVVFAAAGCLHHTTGAAPTAQERADRLARAVSLASGGQAWPAVDGITFTYVERAGDAVTARRHHVWDLRNGTDTITVGDKTSVVPLDAPADADPDALRAWANDSFWLTAPLRLFEGGLSREHLGTRVVRGRSYQVLQVTARENGDTYTLYVDPLTSLVAFWEYAGTGDKTGPATWEAYRHFQGLALSTFHDLGERTISLEAISVQAQE